MLAIIGTFLGMFGIVFMATIGRFLGVLFCALGVYLIWKQSYLDELEEELERRDLGHAPREFHRKNLTADLIRNWRATK